MSKGVRNVVHPGRLIGRRGYWLLHGCLRTEAVAVLNEFGFMTLQPRVWWVG